MAPVSCLLRTHSFQDRAAVELCERLAAVVRRAGKYGITSERDLHKYVNITLLHGPDFDEREETAWTVDYLTDPAVASPTQRIDRLHQEVGYRLEVEEHNAAIEKEFYGDDEDDEDEAI